MIRVKGEGNTKRSKLQVRVEDGNGPSYLGKLKVALQFGHLFHQSHQYPELILHSPHNSNRHTSTKDTCITFFIIYMQRQVYFPSLFYYYQISLFLLS